MRRLCLVVLAGFVALAGCRQPPAELEIPVARPCVDATDVPAPVPPAGPLPADARQAADLLGAVILQLRASERLLRALVAACTR